MKALRRRASSKNRRFWLSVNHSQTRMFKSTNCEDKALLAASDYAIAEDHTTDKYADFGQSELRLAPYQVSVVLPIYNEKECIQKTIDTVLDYIDRHAFVDFILVDDGSTDGTSQLLIDRLCTCQTTRLQLISCPDRQGKGHAVRQGINAATGDYICFMDGDLAYSLAHHYPLLEKLEDADIVIGCRSLICDRQRNLPLTRKITGRIFNLCSQSILNLRFRDMQAGLKGFRKEAAKALFKKQVINGFSFDVELIYLAQKMGYTIDEIPAWVSLSHDHKHSKVNLLRDSYKMLIDLFKIRYNDSLGRYE